MSAGAVDFKKSVFVNCPFDKDYYPLMRALLFTILYIGYTPKITLASLDSGEARIHKILRLIRESKYGVHDLSRLKAEKAGEYFRLNMPLELGMDFGCKAFKGGKWKSKKFLILESKPYRYKAAISDLSNSDIAVHGGEARNVVAAVRNWLSSESGVSGAGPEAIWGAFTDFMAENFDELTKKGFSKKDIAVLPVAELMRYMKKWIARNS